MSIRSKFAFIVILFFGCSFFYSTFQDSFFSTGKDLAPPKVLVAKNLALGFYDATDLDRVYSSAAKKTSTGSRFDEKSILSLPFVEKALLVNSLSGVQKVKVFLQEPALAFYHMGKYQLVNLRGEVFSEVPQYKIPDLPLLRGKAFTSGKNRARAINIYKSFPQEGVLSQKTLSEVLFEEDLVLVFSGIKGRVYLGENDLDKKAERILKVLKYLRFHGIEAKRLDARFSDRVIVSVEDKI